MKQVVIVIIALIVSSCYSIFGHPSMGRAYTIEKDGVPCFALADPDWKDWEAGYIRLTEKGESPKVIWEVGIDPPRPVINKKDCVALGQTFEHSEVLVPLSSEGMLKAGRVYGISMNTSPVGDDRAGRAHSGHFCLSESPSGGWVVHDLGVKPDACPVAQ